MKRLRAVGCKFHVPLLDGDSLVNQAQLALDVGVCRGLDRDPRHLAVEHLARRRFDGDD
jgi:hypothetical protein